jgi:hypothetical protein
MALIRDAASGQLAPIAAAAVFIAFGCSAPKSECGESTVSKTVPHCTGPGTFQSCDPKYFHGFPEGSSYNVLAEHDCPADRPTCVDITKSSYAVVTCLPSDYRSCAAAPLPFEKLASGAPQRVADFNEDGIADIAVPGQFRLPLELLLGKPGGGFTAAPALQIDTGGSLAVVDYDRDGHLDLALAMGDYGPPASTPDQLVLAHGHGDGTFTPYQVSALLPFANLENVGDLNGDGVEDLLAFSNGSPAGQYALLLDKSGTFKSVPLPGYAKSAARVTAGDFDGDGATELVVAPTGNLAERLQRLRLGADGTFTAFDIPLGGMAEIGEMATGDLNGDGALDLVLLSEPYEKDAPPGALTVFLGDGKGGFPTAARHALGVSGSRPLLSDFNGDGKLDVMFVAGYTLEWYPGDGKGGLGALRSIYLGGLSASSVAVYPDRPGGQRGLIVGGASLPNGVIPFSCL